MYLQVILYKNLHSFVKFLHSNNLMLYFPNAIFSSKCFLQFLDHYSSMIILSLIGGYYNTGINHVDHNSKESILLEFTEIRSLDVRGKKLLTETYL